MIKITEGTSASISIEKFKKQHGIHKIIAFSGGADAKIEGLTDDDPLQIQYKDLASKMEERVIGEAIKKLSYYNVLILTGGTNYGAPRAATIKAKEFGMKTIGIYPKKAKIESILVDYLDIGYEVQPLVGLTRWGDESPVFTNLLDGVIVYGGGAGTLTECAHILKINEALMKDGDPVKYIVPISGTGGVADALQWVSGKAEVKARCMPFHKVTSGIEAVDILCEKLDLYDYLITK